MELVERNKITELIGTSTTKYHSCVIATFSFDPIFFVDSFALQLRRCNIRNIVVLVDSFIYDSIAENETQNSYISNKGYTLVRVNRSGGVFHPKVILITGEKEGLLFVGSGNMTMSGISLNEEIWGGFHYDTSNTTFNNLFNEAWHYLNQFSPQADSNLVSGQLERTSRYSKWLNTSNVSRNRAVNRGGKTIRLLYNNIDNTIFQQLTDIITSEVEELMIVAPFYDLKGNAIAKLQNHFKPNKMVCVVDKGGTIPITLINDPDVTIEFCEWRNSVLEELKDKRMHYKIFQFKCIGKTYILFGSANASVAGLGCFGDYNKTNDEISLLLEHNSDVDYLKGIGIDVRKGLKEPINLDDYNPINNEPNTENDKGREVVITYAEIGVEEVKLYFNGTIKSNNQLCFKNNRNEPIYSYFFDEDIKEKLSITLEANIAFDRLVVVNNEGKAVSNYFFPINIENVALQHPSPSRARLYKVLNSAEYDLDCNIPDLLSLVDPRNPCYNSKSTVAGKVRELSEEEEEEDNSTITEEERGRVDVRNSPIDIMSRETVILAEFLKVHGRYLTQSSEELNDNINPDIEYEVEERAETISADSEEGKEEDRVVNIKKTRKAIHKFLEKVIKYNDKKLYRLFNDKQLKSSSLPKTPPTLHDYSICCIALQLLYRYSANTYRADYYSDASIASSHLTYKSLLIQTLGPFLILNRVSERDNRISAFESRKIKEYKGVIVSLGLRLLIESYWIDSYDRLLAKLLVLNILDFGAEIITDSFIDEIIEEVLSGQEAFTEIQYQHMKENSEWLVEIYQGYRNWSKNTTEYKFHRPVIMYKSSVGFSYIASSRATNTNVVYQLLNPGFIRNNNSNGGLFTLENIGGFKL